MRSVSTHLHAGTITFVCVCKPEVSTGTLIHIESLDVHVDTDHTPTTRTDGERQTTTDATVMMKDLNDVNRH